MQILKKALYLPPEKQRTEMESFCPYGTESDQREKVHCIIGTVYWRYSTGYKKLLKDNDFIELIIDETPEHMFDVSQEDKSRGSEIQHWWNNFGKLYKDYIIIDDRTDFLEHQKSKLIQVNPQIGFTDLNLLDAVYLLN